MTELEAEKSLVAGLRCEISELCESHASQLEQYSEKTSALVRYRIRSTFQLTCLASNNILHVNSF